MRQYSSEIERFRQAAIALGELIQKSDRIQREWYGPLSQAILAVEDVEGLDDSVVEGELLEEVAIQRPGTTDREIRWMLSEVVNADQVGAATEMQSRRRQLDEGWAEVRPLIDEALELQTVEYLRSFRHSFSAVMANFHDAMQRHLYRPDEQSKAEVLQYLNYTLRFADRWNDEILNVRKST